MTKRIINLLTVLVMTVSLAGVLPVVTATAETSGDYEYMVLDDGTVEITGYTGSATELEIPSEIDEKPVISIGNSAFNQCESLTSITIPDSVKGIKYCAFAGCTSLTSITIPNSVTSIEYSVFGATPWLENKRKENPLVIVNEILIDGNTCNGDVIIPDGVINIAPEAFLRCGGIKSVTIPDTVTSIGDYAFAWCGNLTSVTIPNSGTSFISYFAFVGTPWLENKRLENPLVVINGILIDGTTCSGNVTIPNNVTSIGDYAFEHCDSLTSITIPNSVTSIGDCAFTYCDSLTSITIPNSVTSIGDSAFYECLSLTSVTIGNSVTSIGDYAFENCDSLTIKCYKGSYVEQYAIENDIKYELLDGSKTPNNQNNNSNNNPNNNSNKPNQTTTPTVSPTNNKKTIPNTNKITVPKPSKVKAVKLIAKKKKLNVKWKKVSGATGYEVMYAKNNKFKGKKTVKVKKNKVTLKRLKSKKKYFVKIRAYKIVNGNKKYGKWSKTVKVKVK